MNEWGINIAGAKELSGMSASWHLFTPQPKPTQQLSRVSRRKSRLVTGLSVYNSSSSYGILFQSVAVSTMWRQSARPEAFLQAEERPMFRGLRSASTNVTRCNWVSLRAFSSPGEACVSRQQWHDGDLRQESCGRCNRRNGAVCL